MPRLPSKSETISLKHSKFHNKDKVLTLGVAMEVGRRRGSEDTLDASTRWSLTSAQQQEALELNNTVSEFGASIKRYIEPALSSMKAIRAIFPTQRRAHQVVHKVKVRISYDAASAEMKLPNGHTVDFSDAPHCAALLRVLFSNKRALKRIISWKHMLISMRSRQILENVGVTESSQLRRTKSVINNHFPDRDFLTGNRGAKVNSKYIY